MQVWAVLDNFNKGDNVQSEVLFASTAARKKLIASLMKDARTYGFDGNNLDVGGNQGFRRTSLCTVYPGNFLWTAERQAWSYPLIPMCRLLIPRLQLGGAGTRGRLCGHDGI